MVVMALAGNDHGLDCEGRDGGGGAERWWWRWVVDSNRGAAAAVAKAQWGTF